MIFPRMFSRNDFDEKKITCKVKIYLILNAIVPNAFYINNYYVTMYYFELLCLIICTDFISERKTKKKNNTLFIL